MKKLLSINSAKARGILMRLIVAAALFVVIASSAAETKAGSWSPLPSPTTDVLKRIYVSGNEAWLLDDTKIYHSSNYPTEQFSQVFTGTNFNDFVFVKVSGNIYGWAVGYSSLGARTTDTFGHDWTSMSLGGTSTYNCVSFPTTLIGFASGTDKRLHKTTNGGLNWSDANPGGDGVGFTTASALVFIDSNTGYVGTGDPRLAKTTNGGVSWEDTDADVTGTINDTFFLDSSHGWAVGASDILRYDGSEWTQIDNPTGHSLYSVFFSSATEGWACGNSGTIIHTTDGGATWQPQDSGTTVTLLDVFFTSPTNGYAVGNNGTILHYTADQAENVRILRTLDTYSKMQDAYNAAADGDTIQAQATSLTETLSFASESNIDVSLKGGYDSVFMSNAGYTTVTGSLTISNGKATVENIIIK